VKKSKMDKQAVKDLMFGGIIELMQNPKYYYYSEVGHTYSRWTDEGKEVLQEYMQIMSWKLNEAEHDNLNKRAKEMVISGLKGETI
jgi:hypothetical protein